MNNIKDKIKSFRLSSAAYKYLMEQEKEYKKTNGNLSHKYLLRKGFSSDKKQLYNLTKENVSLYLSDVQRYQTRKINGPYSLVLNDKRLFEKMMTQFNVTADNYGSIIKGTINWKHQKLDSDELIEKLRLKEKLIIKKNQGGGGKGIYRLELRNQEIMLNNEVITTEQFKELISTLDDYIICEHLTQADYANKIYPGTINTIRVLVMRNPNDNQVFIPIAVHKFGSKKTEPADNVWRGGLTSQVDLETGTLKKAALHSENNKKIDWIEKHPDTNIKIEGTTIPNWESIKECIITISRSLDFLSYVGWDVVVTNNGLKIIEGNNYSDVNILQIHQPLLIDEKVKEFYRHHGVVK